MSTGNKLEFWQAHNGKWYYHIRMPNRKIAFASQGFARRRDLDLSMAAMSKPLTPEQIVNPLLSNSASLYFRP